MGAELFKNIYLFKDLSPKELEQLSEIATVETFNPGDEVFSEGDKAVSLFVIKFGTVRIRRSGKEDVVEVAQLGTGGHFGEMAFVDGEPRSATVVALERTELVKLDFDSLRSFFEKNPAVAVKVYRSFAHFLCGRLRITTMDLSFSREKNIRHF
ncbi:MAG: cyclic nucleotide-binding domain-containing protein [Deltaproteobacteria bacterium]|jgi:CRP/FNR family cyclic AMP-dependent transcriptional regulator|nr:cyclic nucleotide-binding domain-containing protein [Deltaproteobacteria bacterium]